MLPSRAVLFIGLTFVFVGTKGEDGFDLNDALNDGPTKIPPPAVDPELPDVALDFEGGKVPVDPKNRNGNDEFDLSDAVDGEDKYTPTRLPKQPANGDPDHQFGDDDLVNAAGGAVDPEGTNPKGSDQKGNQGAGNSTITGIITGVLLALGGGVSSYVLYQKKKLCFSLTGNSADQSTKQENVHGQREDPQSYSTLLKEQPAGSN
ncbi:CD99 molecule isoform X2 [Cetorhinus maximus]